MLQEALAELPPQPTAAEAAAAEQHERTVQDAREELLKIMRERFLSGLEAEYFDYGRLCDHNPCYDDIEQEGRDAEERWFDDEEEDE